MHNVPWLIHVWHFGAILLTRSVAARQWHKHPRTRSHSWALCRYAHTHAHTHTHTHAHAHTHSGTYSHTLARPHMQLRTHTSIMNWVQISSDINHCFSEHTQRVFHPPQFEFFDHYKSSFSATHIFPLPKMESLSPYTHRCMSPCQWLHVCPLHEICYRLQIVWKSGIMQCKRIRIHTPA